MVKILLDCREHDLIELLKELEPIVKQLDLGDIIITDDEDKELIIIERKSVQDLEASIKDGRYEEQSYRLSGYDKVHNHNIIYLIEGNLNEKKILYSSIFSIIYYKGFSVIQTKSKQDTAFTIINLFDKMKREIIKGEKKPYYDDDNNNSSNKEYTSLIKKEKSANITKENIGILMLSQIPGVSPTFATAIILKYGNLENMVKNMDEINMEDITYINKKGKEQKISKTCCKNIKQYLLNNG